MTFQFSLIVTLNNRIDTVYAREAFKQFQYNITLSDLFNKSNNLNVIK